MDGKKKDNLQTTIYHLFSKNMFSFYPPSPACAFLWQAFQYYYQEAPQGCLPRYFYLRVSHLFVFFVFFFYTPYAHI